MLTDLNARLCHSHAVRSFEQGLETKNREHVQAAAAEMDALHSKQCVEHNPRFPCNEFARQTVEAYFIANRIDLARAFATRVFAASSGIVKYEHPFAMACPFEGTNFPSAELYLREVRKHPKAGSLPDQPTGFFCVLMCLAVRM